MGWGGRRGEQGPGRRVPVVPRAREGAAVHLGHVDETTPRPLAPARRRCGRARPVVLSVCTLAAVLPAACTGGTDDGDAGASPVGGATVPAAADPSGGADPAAVAPLLDDLLTAYNASVNELAGTPALALAPDGPEVRGFLALYEPHSSAAAQAVEFWRNQGAVGDSTHPYTAGTPAFETRRDGPVTAAGDEATFPTCVAMAYETVNADGQRLDVEPGTSVPGEGVAVRVDDEWLLRRLDVSGDDGACTP